MMAYLVQIVDEPGWIIAFKVWHTTYILLSIKYVAELVSEVGQRCIKSMEFLQDERTWGSHEVSRRLGVRKKEAW